MAKAAWAGWAGSGAASGVAAGAAGGAGTGAGAAETAGVDGEFTRRASRHSAMLARSMTSAGSAMASSKMERSASSSSPDA
ncbi:MAG: hypothetical protein EPN61_11360 [Burkholderiaceae bacterium]|nr:MAG: hypothetical protein EPN61_11360 [Burkholderiaceae bacterium]